MLQPPAIPASGDEETPQTHKTQTSQALTATCGHQLPGRHLIPVQGSSSTHTRPRREDVIALGGSSRQTQALASEFRHTKRQCKGTPRPRGGEQQTRVANTRSHTRSAAVVLRAPEPSMARHPAASCPHKSSPETLRHTSVTVRVQARPGPRARGSKTFSVRDATMYRPRMTQHPQNPFPKNRRDP